MKQEDISKDHFFKSLIFRPFSLIKFLFEVTRSLKNLGICLRAQNWWVVDENIMAHKRI